MVHTLLTAGADITAAAEDGTSCLHSAASRGIHGVIAKVLEYRASGGSVDIDQLDNDGQSPLHLAAEAHSAEIIKLLLRAGAELDRRSTSTGATPLMLAARAGRDATAKALLVAGADPNVKGNHRVYQATSLHMAAQGGHLAVVEELIKATARLDARMTLGVSAVGVAAERGHTAVVEALLKAKATVGFKNIHGVRERTCSSLFDLDPYLFQFLICPWHVAFSMIH
jgi:ankyrin repeat protein